MGLMTAGGGLSTSKLALANTQPGDVVAGKKFYAGDKTLKHGTMANQGTKNVTIAPGGSYTIPKGFHSGSGKVTANSLSKLNAAGNASVTATKDGWYVGVGAAMVGSTGSDNPVITAETNGSNFEYITKISTGNAYGGYGYTVARAYLKKGQYLKMVCDYSHKKNFTIVYQPY